MTSYFGIFTLGSGLMSFTQISLRSAPFFWWFELKPHLDTDGNSFQAPKITSELVEDIEKLEGVPMFPVCCASFSASGLSGLSVSALFAAVVRSL